MVRISQEELKNVLRYCNISGNFIWKVKTKRINIGDIAGNLTIEGYRRIMINQKEYRAHHLVWLYFTGEYPLDQLDHINHKKDDNRIENLRQANSALNNKNKIIGRNNNTGVSGVILFKRNNKWKVQITNDKNQMHLGYYDDFFEAVCARKSAENFYKFHINHGK